MGIPVALRTLLLTLLAAFGLIAIGCGDSDSPTSPTQAPGTLAIENLTVQAYGLPGDVTYRLSMRLRETSGSVGVTLTTLGMSLDGNRAATVPIDTIRTAGGRQEAIGPITFPDKSGPPSSSIGLAIGYRDDNGRGGSATASTRVEILPLVTLSGTVTDSVSTHRPIGRATVRVQTGINEGRSAQTDNFGRYALGPLVAGAFRVSYEAGGAYVAQSHPIDIATDATWNVALDRVIPQD